MHVEQNERVARVRWQMMIAVGMYSIMLGLVRYVARDSSMVGGERPKYKLEKKVESGGV